MASTLLVAGEDMADSVLILVQGVIEGQYSSTGKAENGIHSLFYQTFYNYLCSSHLHD
jgi:hypothetical protein